MKKIQSLFLLLSICTVFAFSTKQTKSIESEIYVGIAYGASKKGASAEVTAAVGVAGVAHAALEGAVYGAVFGNAAGAIAGAVIGL